MWLQKVVMTRTILVAFLALAPLACQSSAQIVELSVSPKQEKNFNRFMAWVDNHASLKHNESLKESHRAVFAALKNNDSPAYFAALPRLDAAVALLSAQEREEMYNFFLTLSAPEGKSPLKSGENSGGGECQVECLFGSCRITCPSGTKPQCSCQWGVPSSGCEPFN
jgi:hypothetical protein